VVGGLDSNDGIFGHQFRFTRVDFPHSAARPTATKPDRKSFFSAFLPRHRSLFYAIFRKIRSRVCFLPAFLILQTYDFVGTDFIACRTARATLSWFASRTLRNDGRQLDLVHLGRATLPGSMTQTKPAEVVTANRLSPNFKPSSSSNRRLACCRRMTRSAIQVHARHPARGGFPAFSVSPTKLLPPDLQRSRARQVHVVDNHSQRLSLLAHFEQQTPKPIFSRSE